MSDYILRVRAEYNKRSRGRVPKNKERYWLVEEVAQVDNKEEVSLLEKFPVLEGDNSTDQWLRAVQYASTKSRQSGVGILLVNPPERILP